MKTSTSALRLASNKLNLFSTYNIGGEAGDRLLIKVLESGPAVAFSFKVNFESPV
jgi:hypothetical protein